MSSLTDLGDKVLHIVHHVGSHFTSPDEDWLPTILLGKGEETSIFQVPLPNQSAKQAFPQVINFLFKTHQPEWAATVLMAWVRAVPSHLPKPLQELDVEMVQAFGVKDDPNRQEYVLVDISNGQETQSWEALVTRYPDKPPCLAPWQINSKTQLGGGFANLLAKAFQKLRG